MIDQLLDFAIDHAGAFAALLVATVITTTSAAAWAFGRYRDGLARRRGDPAR